MVNAPSVGTFLTQSEGPLGGDINTESVNISPRGKPFPVNPSKDEMTGLCFEQMYDETRESLRAAAGHSFSAELAEADARKKAAPPRTSEQMVPPEFHEFLDVFDKGKAERLPAHKPHDLGIDLEGPIPPAGRLYQMSSDELRILKEFVDENLAKGYIRQSKAPTGAPVFFVKKKDGSLRMVVDYRALNSVTRKDSYPIPLTAELLDRFRAAKVFTTLDMRAGYYNVRIREGDERKTSFRTRYGQFEFLVMQFGLCNAPAAFQWMVNELFQDLVDVSMVLYLDDIIIFSEDESKHDDQVREVLRRLREADLFLKPEKCAFRTKEVDYLGLKITLSSISMDPVKVSGVTDWPTPQNLRHVNQFLGFCNFYRRFVEDYARIARPLERLKGKTVLWRWGEEEEAAFRELKAAPILMMPDMNAPFVVETDASDFAIGAILSQTDESGELRPVAYYSKAMSAAERNYQVHDKELLAAIRALEEWRPYLEGNAHKVKIFSDHRNLEYFMTMKDLTRRQARWSLFLSRFDFMIVHRPGRLSAGPDGLSRRADHGGGGEGQDNTERVLLDRERLLNPQTPENGPQGRRRKVRRVVVTEEMLAESDIRARAVRQIDADDVILDRIRAVVRNDPQLAVVFDLENASTLMKHRLREWTVDSGLVRFRNLIVVPSDDEIKRKICELYHDSIPAGHPGRQNTLALIARNYYWPRMSEFVNRYVDSCNLCQRSKPSRKRPHGPLQPLEVPMGPW